MTTVAIKTNATEVENKIPDTTGFIATSGFTEATKISFDAGMWEARKSLEIKVWVDNIPNIADENIEKVLNSSFKLS